MDYFFRRPEYYDSFRCTASDCTDNCCIGWEIDIDEAAMNKYRKLQSQSTAEEKGMAQICKRLKENIDDHGEYPHFILGSDERCPFLNEKNLCDIILTLGEENICQICTDHPRFYEWYQNGKEAGVGLCCEEAARLILTGDGNLVTDGKPADSMPGCTGMTNGNTRSENDEEACCEENQKLKDEMDSGIEDESIIETENAMFEIRSSLTEAVRTLKWNVCDAFGCAAGYMDCGEILIGKIYDVISLEEECMPEKRSGGPAAALRRFIMYCRSLEINKPQWAEKLDHMADAADDICLNWQDFETCNPECPAGYRRLLEYFIYRYYMKARYEDTADYRLWFCLASTVMIEALDICGWLEDNGPGKQAASENESARMSRPVRLTLKERIGSCKLYSQEIEYCEENVAAVEDYLDLFLENNC